MGLLNNVKLKNTIDTFWLQDYFPGKTQITYFLVVKESFFIFLELSN